MQQETGISSSLPSCQAILNRKRERSGLHGVPENITS